MLKGIVDHLALRLALVLLEIGLQLLLRFTGVDEEFLSSPEREPADVTVSQARRFANESRNLQVAFGHGSHDGKAASVRSNPRGVCGQSIDEGLVFHLSVETSCPLSS